jgi:MoaE-MoaD fusion protein
MRIEVRLFAMQRVQTGLRSYPLDLPDGSDVAAAWTALTADLPVLAAAGSSVRFARNGRYVESSERLEDGDQLAVIPPVAGGAGAQREEAVGLSADAGERRRRLEVTASTIDAGVLDELRASVATPADGAVAIFLGQTRQSPGTPAPGQEAEAARFASQRVVGLSYEAFEPMALTVLDQIAAEIEARFGVRRVAILHRVGEVALGEASVAIAVAAPHRDEAFAACRYAIEELKARAPIWKAERFADGSVWLGAPARDGPQDPDD